MKLAPSLITGLVLILAGSIPAQAITFFGPTLTAYTITHSGYYAFEVAGGQGGIGDGIGIGGGGAILTGKLYFSQGLKLSILAGTGGSSGSGDNAGGGGGMSFIAVGSVPLIIAGGGGGNFWSGGNGGDASYLSPLGYGGSGRGSGAGWLSDGGAGLGPDYDTGEGGHSGPTYAGGAPNFGYSFGDPLIPGLDPPFNGHSSSGGGGGFGGGGGGGYSPGGGGGGAYGGDVMTGGTSYYSPAALNVAFMPGGNKGPLFPYPFGNGFISASADGYVNLALSAIPEPSAWAILLLGFSAVGIALRRSKRNLKSSL